MNMPLEQHSRFSNSQQYLNNIYPAYTQVQQYRAISKKTLVIFDWDDTILPTTALFRKQRASLDHSNAELERFGKSAYELLLNFINVYSAENIYIVTNGVTGWVQESLKILSARQTSGIDYWTLIHQLLSTLFVGHVISARSRYEPAYPDRRHSALWKTLVFEDIAIGHFGLDFEGESTIISIGDSTDEFIASKETAKMLQTQYGLYPVHLVRMSLKRSPSMESMMMQFDAITAAVKVLNNETESKSVDIRIADLVETMRKMNNYRGADGKGKKVKNAMAGEVRSRNHLNHSHLNPMAPVFSL